MRLYTRQGLCARCDQGPVFLCEDPTGTDDYICASCADTQEEIAWERENERLLSGDVPTLDETHLAAWHEHQKLHRR